MVKDPCHLSIFPKAKGITVFFLLSQKSVFNTGKVIHKMIKKKKSRQSRKDLHEKEASQIEHCS